MIKKFPNRVAAGNVAKRKVDKLPTKPTAGANKPGGMSQPKRKGAAAVPKKIVKSGVKRLGKAKGAIKPATSGKLSGNRLGKGDKLTGGY